MPTDRSILSAPLRDALIAAPSSAVTDFLRAHGWQRGQSWKGKGYDWITPDDERVLVPTDPSLRHYAETLMGVLEMFVTPETAFDDVLTMASNAVSDIVRRKIDEPHTQSGSCSLEEAEASYVGIRDLLRASARRFAAKSGYERALATDYVDQCRAGQTELGSYILKVYAPILVRGTMPENQLFGRRSTIATVENIQFLADETFDPDEPLPPQMDLAVIDAVLKLKASSVLFGEASRVSIKFTRSTLVRDEDLIPAAEVIDVALTAAVFDRAETIHEILKHQDRFERMDLTGYITDLHKDAPNTKLQQHRITIRVAVEGRDRNLQINLIPADYKKAMVWHDAGRLVRVTATIDKGGKWWKVHEYFSFQSFEPAIDPTQPPLF